MAGMNLFTPQTKATVSITSGVSTARVALNQGFATTVRIKNVDASNVAFVEFGTVAVVATVPSGSTTGSLPIGPGETVGVSVGPTVTHVAAICTAGTPIVYFTPGYGV